MKNIVDSVEVGLGGLEMFSSLVVFFLGVWSDMVGVVVSGKVVFVKV